MDQNKNLEFILSLSVVFTIIIFVTNISYFYLALPAVLLVAGLASDKIARVFVGTLKAILNFIVQFFTKMLLTLFFFILLLPIIFFQGLLQKFNSKNAANPVA